MDCPEENVIVDFVRGDLSRSQRAVLEAHIDECPACGQVVAEMARIFAPDDVPSDTASMHDEVEIHAETEGAFSPSAVTLGQGSLTKELGPLLPEGSKLGRYMVLSRIGSGGMGVVYSAYDPELDRKVALKLLRGDGGKADHKTRLLREAQAMAKLSHPNVITVHDVGTFDNQVFMAMEFIDGQTLSKWLKQTHRSWRQTMEVFLAAGRGLQAAHAAGLVHRDFKPDNVLIGNDGRVLVTDFGLARPAAGQTGSFTSVGPLLASEQALTISLTQTGALVGTPAYMAPEQLGGERTDALTDQFSFCVALYEGLYGERPFPGKRIVELVANVSDGKIRPPSKNARVPRWVRRALIRGLAVDPENRYGNMQALLSAITKDPWRRWRRWGSVTLPTAILGVGVAAYQADQSHEISFCSAVERKLDGIWDLSRKEHIRDAFLATDLPYARDAWAGVERRLNNYGNRWVASQTAACHAQIRGEQPQAVLELRMECLDERLDELRALTDLLLEADPKTVEGALNAAGSLRRVELCGDVDALSARMQRAESPGPSESLDHLEDRLARARVLQNSGQYEEALEVATAAVDEARGVGYRPGEAEALLLVANALDFLGRTGDAETRYHQALSAALASGHADVVARVSIGLIWIAGNEGDRLQEALRWSRHGLAALEQLGGDPELKAQLLNMLGNAHWRALEYDTAADYFRQAIEVRERAFGADHSSLGAVLNNMANLLVSQGDIAGAIDHFRRALELAKAEFGASHPMVAAHLDNLGSALAESGAYDEAVDYHRQALALRAQTVGVDHPANAGSHNNLGIALLGLGRVDEAQTHAKEALRIYQDLHGLDHIDVAMALTNLGTVAEAKGNLAEAETHYRRSLRIARRIVGDQHPRTARYAHNLGLVVATRGGLEEARGLLETAVEVRQALGGPDHPDVASSLEALAEVLLGAGETDDAISALEKALAIAREVDDFADLPQIRFALARALWARGGALDLSRARELARRAAHQFKEAPPSDLEAAKHAAEVSRWLQTNAP